jgi:hypothetical protein
MDFYYGAARSSLPHDYAYNMRQGEGIQADVVVCQRGQRSVFTDTDTPQCRADLVPDDSLLWSRLSQVNADTLATKPAAQASASRWCL